VHYKYPLGYCQLYISFFFFLIKKVTIAFVKKIDLKICSLFIKSFTDPSYILSIGEATSGVLGSPGQDRLGVTGVSLAQEHENS